MTTLSTSVSSSASSAPSSANEHVAMIQQTCDALISAFDVQWDHIDAYHANIQGALKTTDLSFVDIALRLIKQLNTHINELQTMLDDESTKDNHPDLFRSLQDSVSGLDALMVNNWFVRNHFGWDIQSIQERMQTIAHTCMVR